MNDYQPREGSGPARIIAYLQSNGGAAMVQQCASHIGTDSKNIKPLLAAAITAGLICYHAGGHRRTVIHLPGVDPEAYLLSTTDAQPEPTKPRRPKKKQKRQVRAAEAEAAPAVASSAVAALWDDGDVVLMGIQINVDNESVTLTDAQARRVHRFLERVYGPNV